MSINIGDKPEFNVVNVGEELTQDQINALNASAINGSPTATNPYLTRTNTFNTTDTAVRITQEGTGEAFRVEDVASDTTAFVINASGNVGINAAVNLAYFLNVGGNILNSGLLRVQSGTSSGGLYVTTTAAAAVTGLFENVSGSTADCVRITNLGSGNSFIVEDDTNPDNSPFVITADGRVGIGTTAVSTNALTVSGATNLIGATSISTSGATPLTVNVTNTASGVTGAFIDYRGTGDAVRITNTGTGNSFVVEDAANPDDSPFVINALGNIGIGRQPTSRKVEMTGNFAVTGQSTLETSGTADTLVVSQTGSANCITATGRNYFVNTSGGGGNPVVWVRQQSTSGSAVALTVTNQGTGNSFVVEDESGDTTAFVIDNAGNVVVGGSTVSAGFKLDVVGAAKITEGLTVGSIELGNTGIRFQAANVVTDIKPFTATAIGGETASYPDEVEIFVNNIKYRVPARVVT